VGLFAFLYGQQDEQQRTIPVAVVIRPPAEDANRELMTQIPASIHVTLRGPARSLDRLDRKSTRLNSSHVKSSYAVFCLKKKQGRKVGLLLSARVVVGAAPVAARRRWPLRAALGFLVRLDVWRPALLMVSIPGNSNRLAS